MGLEQRLALYERVRDGLELAAVRGAVSLVPRCVNLFFPSHFSRPREKWSAPSSPTYDSFYVGGTTKYLIQGYFLLNYFQEGGNLSPLPGGCCHNGPYRPDNGPLVCLTRRQQDDLARKIRPARRHRAPARRHRLHGRADAVRAHARRTRVHARGVPADALFISGSAPLLIETFETSASAVGHTILERYGMSETSMLTSNPCAPRGRRAPRRHGRLSAARRRPARSRRQGPPGAQR